MSEIDTEEVTRLQSLLAKEDAAITALKTLLEEEKYKEATKLKQILDTLVSFREDTAEQISVESSGEEEAA